MLIEAPSGWRALAATGQRGRFALLCLGVWLYAADALLSATVMPAAVAEIGGAAWINWTVALYQLGSIVAAAVSGRVTARLGLRTGLVLAGLFYAGGCAASAVAPGIGLMLFGRLFQGLGGGAMTALASVAICELFPERLWSRLFVVLSVVWGASALCGPLVGGLFAEAGLWRGAFWAFAAQGALLILGSGLQPGRAMGAARSWAALPLLALVLGTLAIAAAGATIGTNWPAPLGLAGLGLLYAFARLDAGQRHRLLPGATLDLGHDVGSGLLMNVALAAATMPFVTYGPLLLALLSGTGPLMAGYLVALEAISWTLAAVATSGAAPATERRLIRSGAWIITAGAVCYVWAVPTGNFPGLIAALLAQGAGFGMASAPITRRIAAAVPAAERGAAAGAVSTVRMIGFAVGSAASGIAANAAGLAAGATPAAAHAAAFWLFAGFVPLGLVGVAAARQLTRSR